ncbi:MAG: hypothetical protein Q7W56_10710 [Candidatus Latescibacteria bacterium]|nr:hypothetical protein [Candidatus Latescibacterota bacterium]
MNCRRPTAYLILGALILAVGSLCGGCGDEGPGQPQDPQPQRVVAELEGAVSDVQLSAGVPSTLVFTLQLPPDLAPVTAAEIDVTATLDHVQVGGVPLWQLIARKVASLFGSADDLGATASIRIGDDPATVCESGIFYGPFTVSHGTSLVVSPETAVADGPTLQIINRGSMILCLTVTANFDAEFSVDAVAVDLAEGNCAAPEDFAGTWTGTYECGNSCGEPFGGDVTLTVTQDGDEASYVDQGGDTYTGLVCGDTFHFERVDDDEIERGTLTLDGPDTATKRSTWRSTTPPYCSGNCVDVLTRAGVGECPPLVITSGQPPDGSIGQLYYFEPTTSGGQGTVTRWAIPTEPIPGLETLSSGVLTGTPTAEAAGSWEVRVTVYDSCPQGGQTVNRSYTIVIGE